MPQRDLRRDLPADFKAYKDVPDDEDAEAEGNEKQKRAANGKAERSFGSGVIEAEVRTDDGRSRFYGSADTVAAGGGVIGSSSRGLGTSEKAQLLSD